MTGLICQPMMPLSWVTRPFGTMAHNNWNNNFTAKFLGSNFFQSGYDTVGHLAISFRLSCNSSGSLAKTGLPTDSTWQHWFAFKSWCTRLQWKALNAQHTAFQSAHDLIMICLSVLSRHTGCNIANLPFNIQHCTRIWHDDILATCDLSLILFFHGAHMSGWILLGLVRGDLSFQYPAELQIHSPAHSPYKWGEGESGVKAKGWVSFEILFSLKKK